MEGKRSKSEWLRYRKGWVSHKKLFLLLITVIAIITPITAAAWVVTSGRCVILTVYTDRLAYASGESIHIHARLMNCGLKAAELTFPNGGVISINIYDSSGEKVFLSPKYVAAVITEIRLEPMEILQQEFTWDQTDRSSEHVSLPNSFFITATCRYFEGRCCAHSAPICISS